VSVEPMKMLLESAQAHYTPCGDGSMVWRRWGSGAPLVLLHGGSGSWSHWIKTIPALYADYEVWAVDLPGLGDSAMPAEPFTPQTCADAVVRGFEQLFSARQSVELVCFSWGCHVGTLAAGELNDRLSGMTIIGCAALGLGRSGNLSLPKEKRSMDAQQRRQVHRGVLENLMFYDPDNIDDLAIELQAINVRNARFRSREFADSTDVRDGLARVNVPLRTIWGARDVVAYPDVNTCIDALGTYHPELEHRIVDNAGHWVMYEGANEFNRQLLDLLAD